MNELAIKKLDETVDYHIRKKSNIKTDTLTDYMMYKFNNYSMLDENSQLLENTMIKLFQNGFPNTIKVFCYYLISNFNHEFSSSFFTIINPDILNHATTFENIDLNYYSLRNYINLNDKEIIEHYKQIESIFKSPKYDINQVILAFHYTQFPNLLIDVFDKLNNEEYVSYITFLKKFYLELSKILITNSLEKSTFLCLLNIFCRVISRFSCFEFLNTKQKIINSIIINFSETLMTDLENIIELIMSFDIKLLLNSLELPIQLMRIYTFYRDPSNPNKKYENIFHRFINFIFQNVAFIYDPEVFSAVNKCIIEFKILDYPYNPDRYSAECFELVSKFLDLIENFEKNNWFDSNMKIISKIVDYIDYKDRIDLIFTLLYECKFISNLNDRIITLFNLFCSLIMINISYAGYFNKESLIHHLFIQNWFVILIQETSPDERDSRFRQDLFICLIESLFYAKKQILNTGQLENYISIIKMGLDIIDVCMKIIEWKDGGEIYKVYFLILEESCLFFDDAFFCFLYQNSKSFFSLKKQLDSTLDLIAQRFLNKVWKHLAFANEKSKYLSLILLSQFLSVDKNNLINSVLEVIFLRLNELTLEKKNEKYFEQLLKSCLYLCLRLHRSLREIIITKLRDFLDSIITKENADSTVSENILSFGENLMNYLLENLEKPQLIINSKIVEDLNNEFNLFIPLDLENNSYHKIFNYNNLLLLNITNNSHSVLNIEGSLMKDAILSSNCNPSTVLDNFKKLYYFPLLEFNHEYSHMLIDNSIKYKYSSWKSISGISDALHIYYKYKLNIENKEAELFIKSYNRTSVPLKNLTINIGLNKNLIPHNTHSLSQYTNLYLNYQEFTTELLSPFSWFEISLSFLIKSFDKNNISVGANFEMLTEQQNQCELTSETFYIGIIDFFIADEFSLYDAKKFEVFLTALDYSFTMKCYINMPPDILVKYISKNFSLVEFKYKNTTLDKSKQIIDHLKSSYYKEFSLSTQKLNKTGFEDFEENQKKYFNLKLSSYCVYNFWVYILILGDYNFSSNKSMLNIEIKCNDLNALKIINTHKQLFLNELFNNNVNFY